MLAPSSSTTSPVCCTARARDRRRVTCSPPRARRAYAAPSPRRSPRCRLSTVSIISLLSLFPPHYHIDNRIGLRRPVPDPPRPGRVSGRLLALTGCPSLIDRPPCRFLLARRAQPSTWRGGRARVLPPQPHRWHRVVSHRAALCQRQALLLWLLFSSLPRGPVARGSPLLTACPDGLHRPSVAVVSAVAVARAVPPRLPRRHHRHFCRPARA